MSDLDNLSEEGLLAELGHRQNKDNWYFIVGSPDAEPGTKPDFLIVHKRCWHEHHGIDDSHIGHLLNLPEGFGEAMESTFEYDGPTEEGERLLQQYGFTKLDNPFWDASLVYVPILRVGWPRLDFTCDTPEIKRLTKEWVKRMLPSRSNSLPSDWNKTNYLTIVEQFTRDNGLVHILTYDYGDQKGRWKGASISLISEELFKSLPEY